jgi:cytochrome bd-type quinol oxidase subunit 2
MDPAQALTGLFTVTFWVLVLIIGITVSTIRFFIQNLAKKVSRFFPKDFDKWWSWAWRESILPALPLITGGVIGLLIEKYPYPEPFSFSLASRIFIGIVAGLFAAFFYPRIKFYLKKTGSNWELEARKSEQEAKNALSDLRNKED